MAELKWIKVNLFLILGLQLTVCAITGSSVFMRFGDDVVLSCQHVINGQINCNGTTWVYSDTSRSDELVTLGEIKDVQGKSNRLSVAPNCSLVMRNITVEDAGYYNCQQYKSGPEPGKEILVHQSGVSLSVVHMTKQKDTDKVTLTCSVETPGPCGYRVKWLHDCSAWNLKVTDCPSHPSGCCAAVNFIHDSYKQSCEFQCEATSSETKQTFNFNHQPTRYKPGEGTRKPGGTTTSHPATKRAKVPLSTKDEGSLSGAPYVAAAVASVTVLIVAGIVVIRWRIKRNAKQLHVYSEVNPTVPVSPASLETSRADVEPEDNVYYSTISDAAVRFNVVGEREDMTYSTVGAPGPPAAALTDPNGLYSLITDPGK